jgi:hypothetical protein
VILRIALLACAAMTFAGGQSRTPPARKPAAIVDSNVRCLLGGSNGLKWVSEDEAAALLTGGETYRLVRSLGSADKVIGGKPETAGGACEGTFSVPLEPAPDPAEPALAVGGDWDLSPRAVQNIMAVKERYAKLFQPFLAASGIKARAEVRQLYRVDLDGDGKDEVVAVLRNFAVKDDAPPSQDQRYSAIFVRRIANSGVQTIAVDVEVESAASSASEHKIAFILDLNNDGKMEIVVYGRYLQGLFTAVYALENGKFKKVLACSCGS